MNTTILFSDSYPILYWLTAIFGGFGVVGGFFAIIFKLFMFTRKASVSGFFGLVFQALNYLILSVWWLVLCFDGGGNGYNSPATSYSNAYTVLPDPNPFYGYWGYSLALTLIYGFWCLLVWLYEQQQKETV
ncbi:hypothetical protein CDG24_25280 [Salmonella enterica subsp. enterica serovar Newport]|nr:hypothetical protein [Salmonella enterica subsp. enterica serovar Newport]